MSERRRGRAPSMMGKNLGVGIGSNMQNESSGKKKSLSRIGSSASQSDGVGGKHKKRRKGDTPAEVDEDDRDFPRDKFGKKKDVIWDKELMNLKAAATVQKVRDQLMRFRVPKPTKTMKVAVKKQNHNYKKRQTVGVAVPAPKDLESLPLLPPIRKGPKMDEHGHVVPHSLLGGADAFIQEAYRHGEQYTNESIHVLRTWSDKPKVTFALPKRIIPRQIPNVDENHALQFWEEVIADRQRQRDNIIARTKRPPCEVIMGEARTYSNYRILHQDSTSFGVLANDYTVSNCKDTRGIGFWNQPTRLGEELTGIYESLTQEKRGHRKGVEYVGVPDVILGEKGYIPLKTTNKQLNVRSSEDEEFEVPDLKDIVVFGANSNSRDRTRHACKLMFEDASPLQVSSPENPLTLYLYPYPSLMLGGHHVTWLDDVTKSSPVHVEVGMNGSAGGKIDGQLEVVNNGTTAVFYNWRKLPINDPFDLKKGMTQRFYFDNSGGVLHPGETRHIRAIFRSHDPGVYSEGWKFESHPQLCGGADITVTLWGIARAVDVHAETRQDLEALLSRRQSEAVCRSILDGVLLCVHKADNSQHTRRKSYRWIFENAPRNDDHFKSVNPGFHYHSHIVRSLLELEPASCDQDCGSESDASTSDMESARILSLATLKRTLEGLPEEDEQRIVMLRKFHNSVGKLGFPVQISTVCKSMSIGRVMWSIAIDDIVSGAKRLRDTVGISSESNMPGGALNRIKNMSKDIKGRRKTQAQVSTEGAAVSNGRSSAENKRRKSQMVKPTPAVQTAVEKMQTAMMCKHDPLKYQKYREKLYLQTYWILCNMVDNLTSKLSGLTPPQTNTPRL